MGFAEGGLLHAGKGPRAPRSRGGSGWRSQSEAPHGPHRPGLTAAWICLLNALCVTDKDGLSTPRPGGELDRDPGAKHVDKE